MRKIFQPTAMSPLWKNKEVVFLLFQWEIIQVWTKVRAKEGVRSGQIVIYVDE